MNVNAEELVDCSNTCVHPNKRVSFVFVGKHKNVTESESHCEDLNGTLAEKLNHRAYQKIQSCCKAIYNFRIGMIQDDVCANNSTRPFRWLSQINQCKKVNALKLGLINNASTENSTCKTVSIATTFSETDIPSATLDNCNKKQPFICQINLETSNPKMLTTTANTATSEEETATQQLTTNRTISTALSPDERETIQQTRFASENLLSSTHVYTAPNTTARMISYPAIIGGVALGCVVFIGLLSVFVYMLCKKSRSQKISSNISSKNGILERYDLKNSQSIRVEFNSNSQRGNFTNMDNSTYNTVVLSNEGEPSLQFQIQENLANLDEDNAAILQPQKNENKNVKKNESNVDAVQQLQDKKEKNVIALQLNQEENEYDVADEVPQLAENENKNEFDIVVQQPHQYKNENEYDIVVEQPHQDKNESIYDTVVKQPHQDNNENEYATVTVLGEHKNLNKSGAVVAEPNRDEIKNVNKDDRYDKLNFQSGNQKSKKRENYENLWQNSLQSQPADSNLMQVEKGMKISPKNEGSRSYSQVNVSKKKKKNMVEETDQSDN